MSDLIHFAHGNGFPSLCYKQMLDHLATRFDYCYIDRIGHDPIYPVTDNWHHLVHELIESVRLQANKPVIALGHSLGGVLSLLAAIEEPSLFKAVIMLDSPLIGRFKSRVLKLAKTVGMIDRITPAHRSWGRRGHWQSHDELIHYLKTRDLFKTFTDECLNDYVTHGMEHKEDGYYLRFDREIEYQIYRTIPHVLPEFEGKFKLPGVLIYGDKSTVVDRMDINYMKQKFHINSIKVKGSHLFPMEHPRAVAEQVINVIDGIIGSTAENRTSPLPRKKLL